jgi:hypothetical protein
MNVKAIKKELRESGAIIQKIVILERTSDTATGTIYTSLDSKARLEKEEQKQRKTLLPTGSGGLSIYHVGPRARALTDVVRRGLFFLFDDKTATSRSRIVRRNS